MNWESSLTPCAHRYRRNLTLATSGKDSILSSEPEATIGRVQKIKLGIGQIKVAGSIFSGVTVMT